jgi:hypothetical protein
MRHWERKAIQSRGSFLVKGTVYQFLTAIATMIFLIFCMMDLKANGKPQSWNRAPESQLSTVPTVLNVRNFGAKGDGRSDDTRAIQSAINAASPFGKIVYLPQGTYLVSEAVPGCGYALLVSKPICLQGEGIYTCLVPAGQVSDQVHILKIKPDPNYLADHTLIEGLFIGNSQNGHRRGNAGIFIDTLGQGSYLPMLALRNCFVAQGKGPALWHANDRKANTNGGMWCALIEHNTLMGGLRLDGSGDSIIVRGNRISGSGVGVDVDLVDGASLLTITENNITTTGGALRIRNARRFGVTNNNCEQVVPGGSEGAMFDIAGTRGAISCGRIAYNHLGAFTKSGIEANIRVKNCEYLVIEQNTLLPASSRTIGIELVATKDIVIGRNTFGAGSPCHVRDVGSGTMGVIRELSLNPAWTAMEFAEARPCYYKSAEGIVHLWGVAKATGPNRSAGLAQLPQGFRPARMMRFRTADSVVSINSTGAITVVSGDGDLASLDGITFLAADGGNNVARY